MERQNPKSCKHRINIRDYTILTIPSVCLSFGDKCLPCIPLFWCKIWGRNSALARTSWSAKMLSFFPLQMTSFHIISPCLKLGFHPVLTRCSMISLWNHHFFLGKSSCPWLEPWPGGAQSHERCKPRGELLRGWDRWDDHSIHKINKAIFWDQIIDMKLE